jgi:TonB family protein
MKILKIAVLSFLALAALLVGAGLYHQHKMQSAKESLRQYRMAQRRLAQKRIWTCEQRRMAPLEPSDSPPLRLDALERSHGKSFNPPVPEHADYFPLDSGHLFGKFVVEALIDEAGCVRQVKILQTPNHALDAATVSTFEKWTFLPATVDHRPVKVIHTVTINFPADDPSSLKDIMIDEDGYPVSAAS